MLKTKRSIILLFLLPSFTMAQETIIPQDKATDPVLWTILLTIGAITIISAIILFRTNNNLRQSIRALEERQSNSFATMQKLEKTIAAIHALSKERDHELEELHEKIVTTTKKLELNRPVEQVAEPSNKPTPYNNTTAGPEVYYANYRAQDKHFKSLDKVNNGISIWKITVTDPTNAYYELAEVDPNRYADRWFEISDIVYCKIPPSGKILTARTLQRGSLLRKGEAWEVDRNNLVEIEFDCE